MKLITTDEFKSLIDNKETFLLDLFATWCGPCKVMINNLMLLEDSVKNDFGMSMYKFDIDTDPDFVMSYFNVRSVPTVKLFKCGDEVFSKSGVMSVNDIKSTINVICDEKGN